MEIVQILPLLQSRWRDEEYYLTKENRRIRKSSGGRSQKDQSISKRSGTPSGQLLTSVSFEMLQRGCKDKTKIFLIFSSKKLGISAFHGNNKYRGTD